MKELEEFRSRSKILVAFGDCACHGCIPSILNWIPPQASAETYEDFQAIHSKKESFQSIHSLSEYVPIDLNLRGCPPHKNLILEVIRSAMSGSSPALRKHPVCVECKLKGNICILTSEGRACMGPVTMAGCGAICPTVNRECEGCYGPMSDANASSLAEEFLNIGLSRADVKRKFRKYAGVTPAFSDEADQR
jgi:coenzyme F420-reducing hydrogenase gamma subunit